MKHQGNTFEYEDQRNDNLMQCYHELLTHAQFVRMPEIYRQVVNMPSARFWVSEERAAIVVSAMRRGESIDSMRPLKREMYNEIYRRASVMLDENPSLSIAEAVARVVAQPAPKFYLTPGSAKVLICKIRKEWYFQRTKRRLRHCF
jgi:hypothetical protein